VFPPYRAQRCKNLFVNIITKNKSFYREIKQGMEKESRGRNIIEILKHYEDRPMGIVVRGGQLFYISQMDDGRVCLMADILCFEDTEEFVYNGEKTQFPNATDLLKHPDKLSFRP
jgi:hypothetical protein